MPLPADTLPAIPFSALDNINQLSDANVMALLGRLSPYLLEQDAQHALDGLTLTLRLARTNTYIVKKVPWARGNRGEFTPAVARQVLSHVVATAAHMEWPVERLDVVLGGLDIRWDRSRLPGAAAWAAQATTSARMPSLADIAPTLGLNARPHDAQGPMLGPDAPAFRVLVQPVLVPPDAVLIDGKPELPRAVWASLAPVDVAGLGTAPAIQDLDAVGFDVAAWWDSYVVTHAAELAQAFGVADLPAYARPTVRLAWSVIAPDGTAAVSEFPENVGWRRTPVNAWVGARLKELAAAAHAFGTTAVMAVMNVLADGQSPQGAWEWPSLTSSDPELRSVAEALKRVPIEHIEFGAAPTSAPEFAARLSAYAHAHPDGAVHIMNGVVDAAIGLACRGPNGGPQFERSKAWETCGWMMLPEIREWIAASHLILPSNGRDLIDVFQEREHEAFLAGVNATPDLPGYIRALSNEERVVFRDLLFWHGVPLTPSVRAALRGAPDPSEAPAPTPIAEAAVLVAPVANPATDPSMGRLPAALPRTPDETERWAALTHAFAVSAAVDTRPLRANPFVRWMARLSPPAPVAAVTLKWLDQNEQFNTLNRDLLSDRGGDEADLTAGLASRLARVMDAARAVMDANKSAGGWWERIRRNASTKDASPEQWADAFMDFQNHMLTMFKTVDEQIARDRSWLAVADDIGATSGQVDRSWSEWLAATAQDLSAEREQVGDTASAEQKIQWNNRAMSLESASTAHDHIRASASISHVLLERVRQSVEVKERLQQRAMMFYWSSLNMFAGLQSIQRTTNNILEQSDLANMMAQSFEAMVRRTSAEEEAQREKLREAFRSMAQSEQATAQFYENLTAFQKDAVVLMGDLATTRDRIQEEAADQIVQSVEAPARATLAVALPEPDTLTVAAPGGPAPRRATGNSGGAR